MAEVTYLFKCKRCGKAHGKPIDITFEGKAETEFTIRTCDECFEKTIKELDYVRPLFEVMLEMGIDTEVASDTMTYLMKRLYGDSDGQAS